MPTEEIMATLIEDSFCEMARRQGWNLAEMEAHHAEGCEECRNVRIAAMQRIWGLNTFEEAEEAFKDPTAFLKKRSLR